MLSTLLTSKAYLYLGSTSLIGISKNNLSSVLLSYFFRKEQSYAIMRAAGSARIIHEKLLCAMGKEAFFYRVPLIFCDKLFMDI